MILVAVARVEGIPLVLELPNVRQSVSIEVLEDHDRDLFASALGAPTRTFRDLETNRLRADAFGIERRVSSVSDRLAVEEPLVLERLGSETRQRGRSKLDA